MDLQPVQGWEFTPPDGPTFPVTSYQDVHASLTRGDDIWHVEENRGHLRYQEGPSGNCVIDTLDIFYLDQDLFTACIAGTSNIPHNVVNPETGLQYPPSLLSLYPVSNDDFDTFVEVFHSGDRYLYPRAMTVNLQQLLRIVRDFYEARKPCTEFRWMSELEFFQRYGRVFYVADG